MDQQEYSFSAIDAEQFSTPMDQLRERLRLRGIKSQVQSLTTSGAVLVDEDLSVPIRDAVAALDEARKIGDMEGRITQAAHFMSDIASMSIWEFFIHRRFARENA